MTTEKQDTEEYRPPLARLKMPDMQHASTKIRWLVALGYPPKEIAPFLGVRYQMVRNVMNTEPKRAAREDLPPLDVEVLDIETDLEAMERQALEQEMAAQRAEARGAQRATNRARRKAREQEQNNEDLDHEDYGAGDGDD